MVGHNKVSRRLFKRVYHGLVSCFVFAIYTLGHHWVGFHDKRVHGTRPNFFFVTTGATGVVVNKVVGRVTLGGHTKNCSSCGVSFGGPFGGLKVLGLLTGYRLVTTICGLYSVEVHQVGQRATRQHALVRATFLTNRRRVGLVNNNFNVIGGRLMGVARTRGRRRTKVSTFGVRVLLRRKQWSTILFYYRVFPPPFRKRYPLRSVGVPGVQLSVISTTFLPPLRGQGTLGSITATTN